MPSKVSGFLGKVRPPRVSRDLRRGQRGVSDGQQVEIPALPIYLKNARDTGVEGKRGRGKTRIERYSETIVTNFQEAHWREKLAGIV